VTTRQKNAGVLVAIVLAAVAIAVSSGRRGAGGGGGLGGGGGRVSAFDAVPEDTFLIAALDTRELRSSALAAPLASIASRIGGLRGAEATCGFDPLARLEELVVAVPEAGDSGDFGVVMRAAGSRDELADCARKVIEARGGEPVVAREDVRDGAREASRTRVSDRSVAGAGRPELVFDDRGRVYLGRGAWLAAMLEAAAGARPSLGAGSPHADLRRALGQARALSVTAILPQPLRDRLRGEMADEAPAGDAGDAAGARNAAMAGVLGVKAAAIGVSGDDHGATELRAELRCETERDCDAVKRLLEKKKDGWSKDATLRLVGLGALVDGLAFAPRGDVLVLTTRAPSDDAARLVERLLDLRFPKVDAHPPPPRATAPLPPPPAPAADEVIRPKAKGSLDGRDGGR